MTSELSPEPTNQELLAYLDGEATPQVVEHINQCPYCRERAEQLARFQDLLTTRLYRAACPTTVELGDYCLGLLPEERASETARHVAECPHCARELAQLREYLATLAPHSEPTPLEQVKVLFAELVHGLRNAGRALQPAPAYALRGEASEPLLYQAGDAQISIEVQADTAHPGRRLLLGFVIGLPAAGLQACLTQQDQPIATVPVDELGNLTISNLAPGTYQLVLRSPTAEVHFPDLEIG